VFAPGSPAGAEYARDPEAHIWATQPLEGLVVLAIAVMCERLYRRRQRLGLPDGAVFAIGAAVYGVARTLLEMLRADSPRSVAGVFSVYQVLGVALFAGATAWMVRAFRTRKTTLAAMS
jgi:prolipoprotein diacylglyceryltransferase